jgi:hypothetical protein
MTQYLLLIQGNTKANPTQSEWDQFFAAAHQSGFFKGGSEVGKREFLGDAESATSSSHIVGFMRFDADDKGRLLDLLSRHPVILHGGSVELCEMPKS